MKATFNNTVIAESNETLIVEGNHYFPPASVRREFLQNSDTHTVCPWKGEASYYDVVVDGVREKDGAWYYPEPKEAADHIKGYIAFWKEITVQS